jgi:hypothetical protein
MAQQCEQIGSVAKRILALATCVVLAAFGEVWGVVIVVSPSGCNVSKH